MKAMYLLRLGVVSLFAIISTSSYCQTWGLWQTYIVTDSGSGNEYRAGGLNADAQPSAVGHYYGSFNSGDTFELDGAEVKTFKNSGGNVCGGTLYYRVYKSCETPGSFNSTNGLTFVNEWPGGSGLPNPGDQRWDVLGENIDLLSGLSTGSYILEFYWEIDGGDSGGCAQQKYDNNGGSNYIAYFDYDMTDSFRDGDFSANPTWSGDTGSYTVVSDSDVAAGATGSSTLRLNAADAGTFHVSTSFSSWDLNQNWSFFFGRRAQALSASNEVEIWLYANEADLESATVDGYRLIAGDNSVDDEFILQSVTDGAGTDILTTTLVVPNGLTDYGLAIQVTRNGLGEWEVLSSALPVSNGDGVIATDCPLDDATTSRGTVTNTDFTPTGTGYFGIVNTCTTSTDAETATEFDQLRIVGNDEGCNDNTACNYIAGSDGSVTCDFSCYGCTDSGALNYDPAATIDDASCTYPDLVITEIHYNPSPEADNTHEFIEILNNETFSVDITGYSVTGISATFPATTTLAAGEVIVVAVDETTYTGNGYQVVDASGSLLNGGETVTIESPNSVVVDTVTYGTSAPWPSAANGSGPSLELSDVNTDNSLGGNWQATVNGGTPGGVDISGCTDPSATNYNASANTDDGSCTYGSPTVVISELHYNPCADQGNDGDFEFLELYNATGSSIDISGWEILGFDFTFPASSSIAADEYIVVVTNGGTGNYTGSYQVFELTSIGAGLANTGETVTLLDASSNAVDYVDYSSSSPWPTGANGGCSSLEILNTANNNNDPTNWQDSYTFGGTPGAGSSTLFECTECGQVGAQTVTELNEDWEGGALTGWVESTSGDWTADNVNPISGSFSLAHDLSTGSGTSHITNDMQCLIYSGTCTTWEFQVENGAWDPDTGDRWLVYLVANEEDLQSATVDGYAVGINYGVNNDNISLYYIVDGAVSSTLMSSTIDVEASEVYGVQVTRDQAGNWMLALDANGGFDELFNVTGSAVAETSLSEGRYFGVLFDYTASSVGSLWIDDIDVTHCGLGSTYYSVSSGNSGDAIWNTNDAAVTGDAINFGRFKRIVVQDGHTVTLNGDMIADDLSTESTGTLSAGTGNRTITVYGNFVNDGTFNAGNSNMRMKGDAAQLIAGTNGFDLYDFTIENPVTVTLATAVNLTNNLYVNDGTLNTGGNLTLFSDASSTAYVAPIATGASISGDVVHMTFLEGGTIPTDGFFTNPPGYTMIGPATTGLTIQDWDDDITTTGMTGSDHPLTPFVNVVSYDETVAGNADQGYVFASNVTDALDEDLGYWLYEFSTDITIDATGPVRQGTITVDLSHTNNEGTTDDGWNLVHNVYAAPVDIEALVSNSDPDPSSGTQTGMSYYVWDMSAGAYVIYQAVTGTGSGSRYLAPNQAFFTRIDATHFDLVFDEDVKDIDQTGLNVVREELLIPTLEASLSDGSVTTDKIFLTLHETASDGYDMYDAGKMYNMDAQTCAASFISEEGSEMAIDARPLEDEIEFEIPVFVRSTAEYTYNFSIDDMDHMPEGVCWSIENLLTGEVTPVEVGTTISLSLEENFEGVALILSARKAASIATDHVSCYGSDDAEIVAEANGNGVFDFIWVDENNATLMSESGNSSTLQNVGFGSYFVTVSGGDMVCDAITVPVNIDQPQEEIYSTAAVMPECNYDGTASISLDVNHENDYSYNLYKEGELIMSESLTTGFTELQTLDAGAYELEVISTCKQESFELELADEDAVDASFTTDAEEYVLSNGAAIVNFTNNSSNASTYNWNMGDGVSVYVANPQHIFNEAGTYEVSLTALNSNCFDNYTREIIILDQGTGIGTIDNPEFWLVNQNGTVAIYETGYTGLLNLEVYDMSGKLVLSETWNTSDSDFLNVPTSGFSQGIYSLRLRNESEVVFGTNFNK